MRNIIKEKIDTPVKSCGLKACSDKDRETERYGLTLLLYGMDKSHPEPYAAHLGMHVCKDCQATVAVEDFFGTPEMVQQWSECFRLATTNLHPDFTHPSRVMNEKKSKIAWRSVGRYEKVTGA